MRDDDLWNRMAGPALQALKLYWPAFLALQGCAVLAVVAYYQSDGVRAFAEHLMGFKERGGMAFVACANVFSGAVIPELFKAVLRPADRARPGLVDWLHLVVLMALLGIMIDAFYALQGTLFGQGLEPLRVATKILIDQFGFTLFVVVPLILIWFEWKAQGFSFRKTAAAVDLTFFANRLPPMFAPNVLFWVPALAAIYSLPTGLQFLLFLFLNGAWCLVMVFIAREGAKTP